jgi:hypothetical protein
MRPRQRGQEFRQRIVPDKRQKRHTLHFPDFIMFFWSRVQVGLALLTNGH